MEFVKLGKIRMIHGISFEEAAEKLARRVARLNERRDEILGEGRLSFALQTELIPSKNPIRVLMDDTGHYVAFDGNGRVEALRRALGDRPDLKIEVQFYRVESVRAQRTLRKIMEMRGMRSDPPAGPIFHSGPTLGSP
jgi:hypothetical protein